MSDKPTDKDETRRTAFSRRLGAQAARKLHAQRDPLRSVWLGLGVTGVIGWSVAAPALVGALLGLWLDRRYPTDHSWTLALLVAGLCIGCFQAWSWVAREDKAMHEQPQIQQEETVNRQENTDE